MVRVGGDFANLSSIPARPDGERNLSLGDAWAFRRQVAFPHASMACHPRGPGTYESASSPWLYQRGTTSSSAYGRAGGRPLLSQGVGAASCRIGFPGELRRYVCLGLWKLAMPVRDVDVRWTRGAVSLSSLLLLLLLLLTLGSTVGYYFLWFYRSSGVHACVADNG